VQSLGRDVAVAIGKQEVRECETLLRRPETRAAQQLGDVSILLF